MDGISRADSMTDLAASGSSSHGLATASSSGRKRASPPSPTGSESVSAFKRPRLRAWDSMSSVSTAYSVPVGHGGALRVLSTPTRKVARSESAGSIFRSPTHGGQTPRLPTPSPSRAGTPSIHRHHPRPLSRASSVTLSVPGSPCFSLDSSDPTLALVYQSINKPTVQKERVYQEPSAKRWFKSTKIAVDFSLPVPFVTQEPIREDTPAGPPVTSATAATTSPAPQTTYKHNYIPLCITTQNDVFFTRGDRVFFKNIMVDAVDAAQLCRLKEKEGNLRCLSAHSVDQRVALGTDKGYVRIYDVVKNQRKDSSSPALQFSVAGKEITAMAYHGPSNPSLLSVACSNGAIRQYDTREKPDKNKTATQKGTRHQSSVLSLAINFEEPRLIASGDTNGIVHCWDMRYLRVPLDVGEFVQRRKKMLHWGPITALEWCRWSPKHLVSGSSNLDCSGTLKAWDVTGSLPLRTAPPESRPTNSWTDLRENGHVEFGTQLTSVHFSSVCKEILFTHGAGPPRPPIPSGEEEDEDADPFGPGGLGWVDSDLEDDDGNGSNAAARLNRRLAKKPASMLWQPDETASSLSIHATTQGFSHNIIRQRVTDNGQILPIGGSVMNASGTRVVVAVPDEGKLKVFECWGKLGGKQR